MSDLQTLNRQLQQARDNYAKAERNSAESKHWGKVSTDLLVEIQKIGDPMRKAITVLNRRK